MNFNGFTDFNENSPDFQSAAAGGSSSSTPTSLEGADPASPNDWVRRNAQNTLLGLYGDNGNARFGGNQNVGNDPLSGQPYDFTSGSGQAWNLQNGFKGYDADNGQLASGYGTHPNNLTPEFLKSIGYTGPNPNQLGDEHTLGAGGLDPAAMKPFQDYLDSKGYQLGQSYTGERGDQYRLQTFDKNNKPVGSESRWGTQSSGDDLFGLVLATLGSAFGGMAGGALAAGGGSALSAGAGGIAGAAGTGAGAAFGGTAARTGDFGASAKAGLIGGATAGLAQGVDVAGNLGVTDPNYATPINSAVGSGIKAGLTGQNIGQSVLNSVATSGLGAGLRTGYGAIMDYNNSGDTNLPSVDDYSNGFGGTGQDNTSLNIGNYSRPANPAFNLGDLGSALGNSYSNASYTSPDVLASSRPDTMNFGDGSWPGSSNPIKDKLRQQQQIQTTGSYQDPYNSMAVTGGAGPSSGRFDNIAGNLMGLYSAWQNKRNVNQQIGNLQGMYGPNSPYAKQLEQTLMRQDAAAGRRSQVGPRSVELQARLADVNARNAPQLASLYNAQGTDRDRMLSNLIRMGMGGPNGGGGFDALRGYGGQLQNWWQQQQLPNPPPGVDPNYDPEMGP